VPRWFESGRAASDLNFNAGVMLLDLEMWRNDRLTDELVKYLTDGRHYFAQDQEALNVVLAQRIGSLDPRWNQQSELFRLECEVALPFSRAEIERLRTDPWIIHYSNRIKPWHYGHSDHPFASEWYASLDRTAYAGWRPRRSRQYVASIAITRLRNGAKRLKLV
jgi:lipopolysaccharide biosynthesis glycosyltransferase